MTTTETTAPIGRYPYLADAGRQHNQLDRLLSIEEGKPQRILCDRDPDVLEQLVDAGYAAWTIQGDYQLTDRGRRVAQNLRMVAAREAAAAEPTEQFDAVPASEDEAPAEGTLPGAPTTGRHRIVKKSRVAWVREHLTVARVAVLSASAGVLIGVGFMWLVTR